MADDPRTMATEARWQIDPVAFARGLGFEPDLWQQQVLRTLDRRVLLNIARQMGKSTTCALKAYHRAKYRPGALILCASKSERQAKELLRKVKDFRRADPRPVALVHDSTSEIELCNGSRIVSLPATEDSIRCFSAVDMLLEDEASRVPDALYLAVRPMLSISRGQLLMMSTPFGRRGHFYDSWQRQDRWTHIRVQATDCPRHDPAFLEEERIVMGPWYAQEYECEFLDAIGSLFRGEDMDAAWTDSVSALFGEQSLDPDVVPLMREAV